MLGIVFKSKDGNVVVKAGDDKMYLLSGYKPSDDVEIIVNRKLKPVPARWDKVKLLSAIYDVCKLKKAILFAIKSIEEKNRIDNIKDKKLKKILYLIDKLIKSKFRSKYLIELFETVKKINENAKIRYKNNKNFKKGDYNEI